VTLLGGPVPAAVFFCTLFPLLGVCAVDRTGACYLGPSSRANTVDDGCRRVDAGGAGTASCLLACLLAGLPEFEVACCSFPSDDVMGVVCPW